MKYKQIISCAILASLGILAACRPSGPEPTPTVESVGDKKPTAAAPLPAPTDTLEANLAATLPFKASTSAPIVEAIPNNCGSLEVPLCNVQQAEGLAGFTIRVPTRLPEGLEFLGAVAEPEKSSTLVYGCGEDCRLTIYQQIWNENRFWSDEGLHGRKRELAVIGSYRGAYLASSSGNESSTITPFGDPAEASQVLQWPWTDNTTGVHYGIRRPRKDNTTWYNFGFRISQFGTPADPSQLDRERLIELAHNTIGVPMPSGLIAFETNRDGNAEIYAMEYHSKERINLTSHPAADHSFAWSPDGEQIAFLSDRSGAAEVYIMGADGSNVQQLTEDSGVSWISPPAWSRDSERMALIGAAPEHGDRASLVYLVNTDGSGYSLLSDEPVYTSQPLQWSPDGQWVAYTENFIDPESGAMLPYPTSSGLKAIAVEGGRRIKLSGRENVYLASFAWSPDGHKLAYAWIYDPLHFHYYNIAIANADGSDRENISGTEEAYPPSELAWSPDGSLLAFIVQGENKDSGLTVYDYQENEDASNMWGFKSSDVCRLSWSPTGMQILYALDWGTVEEPNQWIAAALLEENFSPPSRLSVVEIINLEGSDANTGDNAYPQWQPRP